MVVADNHTCFRLGLTQVLRQLPGVVIVGETTNGNELLQMAHNLEPDLVFVEADLDGMHGTEACRLLLQYNPGILILALSWYENEGHIHAMLSAGARGFLAKTVDPQQVVEAIRTVRETNRYYLGTRKMQLAEYFTKCKYPSSHRNRWI